MKENMSHPDAGRAGPVLVVAPTSLLVNWEEEVDKHLQAPGLGNVVRLYGSALGGRKRRACRASKPTAETPCWTCATWKRRSTRGAGIVTGC